MRVRIMLEPSTLRRRLAEAIAWCALCGSADDPARSLRSPLLRPITFDEGERWCRYRWGTHEERLAVVETLAVKRAEMLASEPSYLAAATVSMAAGCLLLYYPDANLFDGAAERESQGFFDVDNAPPWDTWVAYMQEGDPTMNESYSSCLVSWVPPHLLELARRSVDVNPEECIVWADAIETPGVRHLRAPLLPGARLL
jgi:hypothetical protein